MKELLEAIWKDKKVRCPSHIVWWSDINNGYLEFNLDHKIWWRKGRRSIGKRKRNRK